MTERKDRLPTYTAVAGVAICLSMARAFEKPFARYVCETFAWEYSPELRRLEESEGGAGVWLGLVFAAVLTKLTASVDDVVWLLPFVTGKQRLRNGCCYLAFMQLVVCTAWAFTAGGEALLSLFVPKDDAWPLERILGLCSALLLTAYAAKLFRDWYLERYEGDDEGSDEAEAPADDSGLRSAASSPEAKAIGSPSSPVCDDVEKTQSERKVIQAVAEPAGSGFSIEPVGGKKELVFDQPLPESVAKPEATEAPDAYSVRALFTISIFGSLDDFAVFVSLMLSGLWTGPQLSLGVLLATIVVVMLCISVGKCSWAVNLVEKVPLWCIILIFALWTHVSVWTA